jgi:hypothetical protein
MGFMAAGQVREEAWECEKLREYIFRNTYWQRKYLAECGVVGVIANCTFPKPSG